MRKEEKWENLHGQRIRGAIFSEQKEKERAQRKMNRGPRAIFVEEYLKNNMTTIDEAIEGFVKKYKAYNDEEGRKAVAQWAKEELSRDDEDER